MIATRLLGSDAEILGPNGRSLFFVPVDGSGACERIVDLAIRLARQSQGEIVLVDWLARDEIVDLVCAPALVPDLFGEPMAAGVAVDGEARTARRLRQVLFPLQARVGAAGLEVSGRLLHGEDPAEQLRAIVASAGPWGALVLSNPLDLFTPLRALTADLLLNPPCTIYLARAQRLRRVSWPAAVRGVLRSICRRLSR